jgi:hypothetical protein
LPVSVTIRTAPSLKSGSNFLLVRTSPSTSSLKAMSPRYEGKPKVHDTEPERAAASAGGLGVQSQQQCVEDDVVAGGAGDKVDLLKLYGGQGAADAGGRVPGAV